MAITPLPDPPSRSDPANFADEADAFLSALPTFGNEANALAVAVAEDKAFAAQSVVDAAAQATLANGHATTALGHANSAAASANYQGIWGDLTGALNVPATVAHADGIWLLNTNLADVTLSEPADANADWTKLVSTGSQVTATSIALGTWTITDSAGKLTFSNGASRFSISSTGAVFASGNVTAFGAP